jgi:hypothetical protein
VTRRSALSTCCWGCCGTPRTRWRPSHLPRSDGCGVRSGCPPAVPAIKRLVEARGLSLETLRAALLSELDQDH